MYLSCYCNKGNEMFLEFQLSWKVTKLESIDIHTIPFTATFARVVCKSSEFHLIPVLASSVLFEP